MARGIDILNIDVVINYSVPQLYKTYLHRSGRTARAGRNGFVYTMVEDRKTSKFNKIRRIIKADEDSLNEYIINEKDIKELNESYTKCLKSLQSN